MTKPYLSDLKVEIFVNRAVIALGAVLAVIGLYYFIQDSDSVVPTGARLIVLSVSLLSGLSLILFGAVRLRRLKH